MYAGVIQLRNRQYDNGNRPVTQFERIIISVGNLSTGGTGKTPMIEFLIRLLKSDFQLATVSRGYGRKTSGERIANSDDTARSIGDEPFQFYKKFGREIKVVVGEERVLAIPRLLMDHPEIELILLDDAYQHRKVNRDFNLLLTDYAAPFYQDFVLPTGNLREGRSQAKRADAVIMTKCPIDLSVSRKDSITAAVRQYCQNVPVYFSHIEYGDPISVFSHEKTLNEIVVITAIAKPKLFFDHLSRVFSIVDRFEYVDHYNFKSSDLDGVYKKLKGKKLSIFTTEKDMVRLLPFGDHPLFKEFNLFYVPIEMKIDQSERFQKLLMECIEKRKGELNS